MGALGIIALVIQIIIVLCIVAGWVALAVAPGRIAHKRGHPQAEAIKVCGWFGALSLGLLAPVAFVWAYSTPLSAVVRPEAAEPQGTR